MVPIRAGEAKVDNCAEVTTVTLWIRVDKEKHDILQKASADM